jgi:pimeloyl-ACP methyl ester carboxylesterase
MKSPGIGAWRNDEARRRFVELEDALWDEHWPRPPMSLDVESFAGTTRLYQWAGTGDPIVFLHGMGGTALAWTAYVNELTGHDVYALDTIGDVGRSDQRAIIEDAAALATWLDQTLLGAGISRAHLVGTSYGGFLALNLAARMPERVASLTLIDSGGLAPIRLGRFLLWGLPTLFGVLAPGPIRRRLARSRPLLEDPRVVRLALQGQQNHPFRLPKADPLTDDQLRSVTAPAAVLIAETSAPFDPKIQAERAALLPRADIEVIEGAGHEVSWTHVDRCLEHIRRNQALST